MFKYLSTIMKNCEKTTANQIFYKCNETSHDIGNQF